MEPQVESLKKDIGLSREYDSVDDFEHLEAAKEGLPASREEPAPAKAEEHPPAKPFNLAEPVSKAEESSLLDRHEAPLPERKGSPLPERKGSPLPERKESPMPERKESPMPERKESPMPEREESPMPERKDSPMPERKDSPMPERKDSPMPERKDSPMPEMKDSPLPERKESPMPESKESPMPEKKESPMPEKKESPMPEKKELFGAEAGMDLFDPLTSAKKESQLEADLLGDFSTGPLQNEEPFSFGKPLPKEPADDIQDFLKAESGGVPTSLVDIPPPIPKHQNFDDDSPMDAFEPSQTPEPEFDPVKPLQEPSFHEPEKPSPRPQMPEPQPPTPPKPVEKITDRYATDIGAKDLFVKYGLVESLVYWRDPKKSGIVFGVLMVSLLSLAYFSLISVVAYLCLIGLSFTISFRIYKNVMQAVQKSSDGHPFKELLELELTLPEDKVEEACRVAVVKVNKYVAELRRLFLVEDFIDSIKFGVVLWVLTYLGAWFNGLTLLIIGVIAVFSLPKVYENNKSQIDNYLSLCTNKLTEITNKVRAAVPMGKKEEKKDQ